MIKTQERPQERQQKSPAGARPARAAKVKVPLVGAVPLLPAVLPEADVVPLDLDPESVFDAAVPDASDAMMDAAIEAALSSGWHSTAW